MKTKFTVLQISLALSDIFRQYVKEMIRIKYGQFSHVSLGSVAKLWEILKRLIFKQSLIYTRLSFKKDGFKNKLYFLPRIKLL